METNNNYEHQVDLIKTFTIIINNDIVKAREFARELSGQIGFSTNQRTLIATAVSEVCRNMIEYANNGEISFEHLFKPQTGIRIIAEDKGPGISNVEKAMQDGYSTGRGMGIGLPGTKRIMDHFEIISKPEAGTRIIMSKWVL